MPTPEEQVLQAAAAVVECTPEAMGQRMGAAITAELDASLRQWLFAETRHASQMLATLGVVDPDFVAEVLSKILLRYGEALR